MPWNWYVSFQKVSLNVLAISVIPLKEGYFQDPQRRNHDLKYIMESGRFVLWTSTYGKVSCPMNYAMYPFDTHECKFEMRSITKNMTYEVRICFELHV